MKTERDFLEGLLTARTCDQLRDLAREFRLKGFSRLDKESLVSRLLDRVEPGTLRERLLPADHPRTPLTPGGENPVQPTPPPVLADAPSLAEPAPAAPPAPSVPVVPGEHPAAAAAAADAAAAIKAKKEKRLSSFGTWASILGCGLGVIALVVTFILSSSSGKQIDRVGQKLDNYDPLKRDAVLKEKDELLAGKDKLLTEKDSLLNEKEKKIKELEKALETLCAGTSRDRQAALEELRQGHTAKARELLDKAISSQCGVLAEDYYQKGNAYFVDNKPQYREALSAYQEADRLAPGQAKYLNMVGVAYFYLGEYRRALDYWEKALAIDIKAPGGAGDPGTAVRLNNIGMAWDSLGQYEKAIRFYEKALAMDRRAFGEQHPNVARDLNNLGGAWDSLGQYEKAIGYYKKALAIDRRAYGEQHPHVAIRLNNLGMAWYSLGQYEKAIGFYEKALAIDRRAYGEQHPDVAIRLNNLGMAYYARGDFRKSVEYIKKALSIMEKCLGSQHPNTITFKKNLEMAEKAAKR